MACIIVKVLAKTNSQSNQYSENFRYIWFFKAVDFTAKKREAVI